MNGGTRRIAVILACYFAVAHLKLIAAAGTGLRNGPETTRFVGYLGFQFFTGQ
jgi:hypothetical protein